MTEENGPRIPLSSPDPPPSGDPIIAGAEDAPPRPAPRAEPPRPFALTVFGALAGAAVGAFVWFLIEFYLEYQVGYVALLVGALAGWGAILFGRRKSQAVGLVAALAGVLGIFAGSYATYFAALRSDDVLEEWRKGYDDVLAELDELDPELRAANLAAAPEEPMSRILAELYRDGKAPSPEEREAAFDEVCALIREDISLSYASFVTEDSKYLMYLGLFGLFGLFIGFKVGSGRASA